MPEAKDVKRKLEHRIKLYKGIGTDELDDFSDQEGRKLIQKYVEGFGERALGYKYDGFSITPLLDGYSLTVSGAVYTSPISFYQD